MSEHIEKLIDALGDGDMVSANDAFNSVLDDKIAIAIEQEKISVANTFFNDSEDEEIIDDDFGTFSDDEIQDEFSTEE